MKSSDGLGVYATRLFGMLKYAIVAVLIAFVIVGLNSLVSRAQTSSGGEVTQVSAGYDTTCAVVDFWVKCWGSNDQGRLGTGLTSNKTSSSPVKVANNKNVIPADAGVCAKKGWFGSCSQYSREPAPAKPASAMAGLSVQKVSVGKTHVCALADARVFCWGDNAKGQLGDRSTKDSSVPVAVDVQVEDVAAVYANPSPCGGWFQPACKPKLKESAKPKSGLGQKEIMDVVAGDGFSCALATDGTVSCWGEGDNGRLGNGSTTDVSYPVAVATNGALDGKRGVKLAKVSQSTVCVLALPAASESEEVNGHPYCWGYGVGDGTIPTGKGSSTTKCSKTSPKTKPSGTSKDTYFHANRPVQISNTKFFDDLTSGDYVTALGDDKKAYYWGMHGHRELTEYNNVQTCVIKTCVGVSSTIQLVGYTSKSRTTTQKNKTGGTTKNTNHYSGRATPTTKAKAWSPDYDGCKDKNETHYGFTKVHRYVEIGKLTPTAPTATSLTSGLKVLSGGVQDGLFCGVTNSGPYCDANGTSMEEGQTGSNYTKQCTTTTTLLIFKTTTCDPAPTGPQKVTTSGWLGNKSISEMSTGNGYTCALADGTVACWGVNSKGQLGTGNTSNKLTPAVVNL